MIEKVYTKAPRPVRTIIFFGQGRFRRFREGALADNLDRQRDPAIVMESVLDANFIFDAPHTRRNVTTTLHENGALLAAIPHAPARCSGRRRPDIKIYIVR